MVAAYYLLLSTGTPSFLPLHKPLTQAVSHMSVTKLLLLLGHTIERVAAAAAADVNAIALQ
jgi:hypothetical protein